MSQERISHLQLTKKKVRLCFAPSQKMEEEMWLLLFLLPLLLIMCASFSFSNLRHLYIQTPKTRLPAGESKKRLGEKIYFYSQSRVNIRLKKDEDTKMTPLFSTRVEKTPPPFLFFSSVPNAAGSKSMNKRANWTSLRTLDNKSVSPPWISSKRDLFIAATAANS